MGLQGISPGSLLLIILLAIIFLGGKRIRNLGKDLAVGLKSFREGMKEEPKSLNKKRVKKIK